MRILVGSMKTATSTERKKHVRAQVIAERYDVTERCVFNWADKGRIPVIRIGKTARFDFEAVIEAIEGEAAPREAVR
jgi:hypothetical protein